MPAKERPYDAEGHEVNRRHDLNDDQKEQGPPHKQAEETAYDELGLDSHRFAPCLRGFMIEPAQGLVTRAWLSFDLRRRFDVAEAGDGVAAARMKAATLRRLEQAGRFAGRHLLKGMAHWPRQDPEWPSNARV